MSHDVFMTNEQELKALEAKHPYSKIDVDIWAIEGLHKKKNQLTANAVWWVRARPYKIKRKSNITLHFMPRVGPADTNIFSIMNRTPIMYKKSEHPDVIS